MSLRATVGSVAISTILMLAGCASVQGPGYISRVDHPYDREIYGSFDKVTSTIVYVLKNKGWAISEETEPSVYERDDRYDNDGYQNLLVIAGFRKQNLNVFVHGINNACDVEIRYEAKSLVKPFASVRNDHVVDDILDAVQEAVNK